MRRYAWRLLPALAALALDAATKAWAAAALAGRGTVWLLRPWLSLQLLYNRGATLGAGAAHARLLTIVAALAVPVLAYLLLQTERGVWGLSLMLGGAAGNLASRLSGGAVTDFAHLWFWPGIFNLADVFLRLGALLALLSFLCPAPAAGGGPAQDGVRTGAGRP